MGESDGCWFSLSSPFVSIEVVQKEWLTHVMYSLPPFCSTAFLPFSCLSCSLPVSLCFCLSLPFSSSYVPLVGFTVSIIFYTSLCFFLHLSPTPSTPSSSLHLSDYLSFTTFLHICLSIHFSLSPSPPHKLFFKLSHIKRKTHIPWIFIRNLNVVNFSSDFPLSWPLQTHTCV